MSVAAMKLNSGPTLANLLRDYAVAPEIPVAGIASDSRELGRDFLFLACDGATSHGLDYLRQAQEAGVCAIAWDSSTANSPDDIGVPMIAVENLAQHLGDIANRFYGQPSSQLKTIGVTGTNGKTTVAWMIKECLRQLDQPCGYVGTLGFGLDDLQMAQGMTTPAAVELHGRLANFVDQRASHAAIEVSSHALSQGRVDGVEFDAALFTNLTRDHLDYHGDMGSYFESKASLFLAYPTRHKIINIDSEFGAELAERCDHNVVTVSTAFDRVAEDRAFVFITVSSSWGDGKITLPMPGEFNVANAVLVLAYLLTAGIDLEQACDVLALLEAPPGRMQKIAGRGSSIYVDYAHTPDAIESALQALRPHSQHNIWCVFGCGGDRDVGKRPLMGGLVERLADKIVVTTDNPRNEDPKKIIEEILAGLINADKATVIEDRAAAIAWTIAEADPSDVVLIAGKGHEDYQEVAGVRRPFSDVALAAAAVERKEGEQ